MPSWPLPPSTMTRSGRTIFARPSRARRRWASTRFSWENSRIGIGGAVFHQDARVAAADDLGHGGEVVLALDGLDAVAAVVLVVRLAIGEADHRGDDVVGGDVGDVEALHDARRSWRDGVPRRVRRGPRWVSRSSGTPRPRANWRVGERVFSRFWRMSRRVAAFSKSRFSAAAVISARSLSKSSRLPFPSRTRQASSILLEVVLAGDAADAGGGAVADDVGVAVFVVGLAGIDGAADAQAEAAVEPFERAVEGAGVGERAEVARAVVLFHAGGLRSAATDRRGGSSRGGSACRRGRRRCSAGGSP